MGITALRLSFETEQQGKDLASPKHSPLVEGLALPLEAIMVWEAYKLEGHSSSLLFHFLETSPSLSFLHFCQLWLRSQSEMAHFLSRTIQFLSFFTSPAWVSPRGHCSNFASSSWPFSFSHSFCSHSSVSLSSCVDFPPPRTEFARWTGRCWQRNYLP